jgi:sulfate adenylyltransferase large subunit
MASAERLAASETSTAASAATSTLLRFTTAGSVDDGKSTLIGRLLYDSRAVYQDQIASMQKSSINRSSGPLDFSLLTDGLRAEREQGITIDVAYRYFSSSRRRFIIADTPGHEQYTRNMVTGASIADAALVLVDATQGLLRQSRRHLYIAALLGIGNVAAVVNKMDLIGYQQRPFENIAAEFADLARLLGVESVLTIPVSALCGDNVVQRSDSTPWYHGPSLIEWLETVPARHSVASGPLRFPVQYVIRPDAAFRGFAGEVISGTLRRGTRIVALPSRVETRVKSIHTFGGELEEAAAGVACTVTLEDQIDLGRGDLLCQPESLPQICSKFSASLVWLDSTPWQPERQYFLKHTTRTVRARLIGTPSRLDVNTFQQNPAGSLQMNDIAECELETTHPLFVDPYAQNRTMGSFILIDPISNATVAAGMIREKLPSDDRLNHQRTAISRPAERNGHPAVAIWTSGELTRKFESACSLLGWRAQFLAVDDFTGTEFSAIARLMHQAGAVVIYSADRNSDGEHMHVLHELYGDRLLRDHVFFEANVTAEQIAERLQMMAVTLKGETDGNESFA